ncbi:MAG: Ig-like domain-containing protein, partial [Myxococcota bacterium]
MGAGCLAADPEDLPAGAEPAAPAPDPEIVEPASAPPKTNDISRRSAVPVPRLGLDDLNPVIAAPAEPNRIPATVQIRFDRPVVESPGVAVSKMTDVELQPAVAGRWRFTDRYTLTYQPKVGFRPDTEYTVTLRALQSEDGEASRPAKRSYRHTFATPSLRLLRLDLVRWSSAAHRADVEVVFSGPVNKLNPRNLRWTVDGIQRQVKLRRVRPDLWSASIVDASLRAGSVVKVATVGASVFSAVD